MTVITRSERKALEQISAAGNDPDVINVSAMKPVLVTCCGRICLYRKKINLSKSLPGQGLGVKEVDDGT